MPRLSFVLVATAICLAGIPLAGSASAAGPQRRLIPVSGQVNAGSEFVNITANLELISLSVPAPTRTSPGRRLTFTTRLLGVSAVGNSTQADYSLLTGGNALTFLIPVEPCRQAAACSVPLPPAVANFVLIPVEPCVTGGICATGVPVAFTASIDKAGNVTAASATVATINATD
jgi:hypothetical protein